jgi:hypothetical protein
VGSVDLLENAVNNPAAELRIVPDFIAVPLE